MHIINIKALSEMFFGDSEKIRIVVGALVERIPEWQDEARTCAEAGNHQETRELCHRIRGAAGSIKAEKLTEAVTLLGNIIREERYNDVASGFEALHISLDEIHNLSIDIDD